MAEGARELYRWGGAIAGVLSLTLVAACNSGDTASGAPRAVPEGTSTPIHTPRPSGPPTVSIRHNKVSPSTLKVETGATVRIRNYDAASHRLDNRANHLYAGSIPGHGKGELTAPPDPGSYVFTDPNHSSVRMTLKVR